MPIPNPREREHAEALVVALLDRGAILTIDNGEEIAITRCADQARIMDALGDTDVEWIYARDKRGNRLGSFRLVYGIGANDLIAGHTDSDFANAVWAELEPVRLRLAGAAA